MVEVRLIPGAPDYAVGTDGEIYSFRYERKLQTWLDHNGRRHVEIRINKKRVRYYVSRLVATVWLGAPKGRQVHHINGDGTDDRVVNLVWVTRDEHLKRHGLSPRPPKRQEQICPCCHQRIKKKRLPE